MLNKKRNHDKITIFYNIDKDDYLFLLLYVQIIKIKVVVVVVKVVLCDFSV
jgi:hypothetical protein